MLKSHFCYAIHLEDVKAYNDTGATSSQSTERASPRLMSLAMGHHMSTIPTSLIFSRLRSFTTTACQPMAGFRLPTSDHPTRRITLFPTCRVLCAKGMGLSHISVAQGQATTPRPLVLALTILATLCSVKHGITSM